MLLHHICFLHNVCTFETFTKVQVDWGNNIDYEGIQLKDI